MWLAGGVVAAIQNAETALICAAENGQVACVRLLVEAGADKNAKDIVRASTCRLPDTFFTSRRFRFNCVLTSLLHTFRVLIEGVSDTGRV